MNLKVYNKILKKSIRDARKKYFDQQFEKYKGDIKNTWKTISEALCNANYKNSVIHKIVKNNLEIDNPSEIAEVFNDYFINIGPELFYKIKMPHNKNFKSYMQKRITSSFSFRSITIEESQKVVDSLKSKTLSAMMKYQLVF